MTSSPSEVSRRLAAIRARIEAAARAANREIGRAHV